jgi:hypothetical protein
MLPRGPTLPRGLSSGHEWKQRTNVVESDLCSGLGKFFESRVRAMSPLDDKKQRVRSPAHNKFTKALVFGF